MTGLRARTAVCSTLAAAVLGAATLGLAPVVHAELYGDPIGAQEYWTEQSFDDCVLMSVADVVGQVTGELPSEDEIISVAVMTPSANHPGSVYAPPADPDDLDSAMGTDGRDTVVLLAQYGVDADYTNDDIADDIGVPTGMGALQDALGAGRKVIAMVNSATIWDQDGDRDGSDHALVVTGVDTDARIVHLNDSGTEDGCDEQVPLRTFESAWSAGGHAMVITS